MSNGIQEHDNAIFHEMMSHPALFTHPHPKKIAIIEDEDDSILREVLKHSNLTEVILIKSGDSITNISDTRIKLYSSADWTNKITPNSTDIVINAASPTSKPLQEYFNILDNDGILVQQSASPFQLAALKAIAEELRVTGFNNQQILTFPQPNFSSGWRSAFMASKKGIFKRVCEKSVFSKSFKTYYYNLDTHKASLVLPEFMRKEWVA